MRRRKGALIKSNNRHLAGGNHKNRFWKGRKRETRARGTALLQPRMHATARMTRPGCKTVDYRICSSKLILIGRIGLWIKLIKYNRYLMVFVYFGYWGI